MKLPNKIKVGYLTFKIKYMSKKDATIDKIYGDCDISNRIIRVCKGYGVDHTRSTLLHEIMHAIYFVNHIEDKDKEEKVVSKLSVGFYQVIQDNPKLMNYFMR